VAAQGGTCCSDDVTLGRTAVGDDGIRSEIRAMRSKISGICATGVATSTMSASPISCPGLIPARSITPSSCATRSVDGVRPKPTTSSTAPAALSASAKEPPIRPVPKTTILPNSVWPASIYSTFSSAAMKRAFSASVPMVTRSHSGMP
jgi:hypothetical protein